MNMSKEVIRRRYERLEKSKKKVDWRKELVSDLKMFVMLELVGCGLFVIVEVLKYGG